MRGDFEELIDRIIKSICTFIFPGMIYKLSEF